MKTVNILIAKLERVAATNSDPEVRRQAAIDAKGYAAAFGGESK